MNKDNLIQVISEAFEGAISGAVDARIGGVIQQMANLTGQYAMDVDTLKQRVAALELRMPIGTDATKVRELIDMKIEEAFAAHANTYDHDSYDSAVEVVNDVDFDSLVNKDDIESEVKDILRNVSISLDF